MGIMDYSLCYPTVNDFTLITYSNVDWIGYVDERKNTNGGAFYLGVNIIT